MRKNGQSEYVRKEASAGWVMVHHGLIPPKLTCISITCAVVKNTCMSIYNRKFRITAKVSASRYIFITNAFKQGSMLTVLADMLFDILAVSIHWRAFHGICEHQNHVKRFSSEYINVLPIGGQAARGHRGFVVTGEANPNGKMMELVFISLRRMTSLFRQYSGRHF